MSDVLFDQVHERFAQLIASGKNITDAASSLGKSISWGKLMMNRSHVANRIERLKQNAAKRAEITRQDIINGVKRQMHLAEKLGQMSAALKASEMLGKELHRMFVDRKELGAPGDFDNKTEEELKEFIAKELEGSGFTLSDISEAKSKALPIVPIKENKTVN